MASHTAVAVEVELSFLRPSSSLRSALKVSVRMAVAMEARCSASIPTFTGATEVDRRVTEEAVVVARWATTHATAKRVQRAR